MKSLTLKLPDALFAEFTNNAKARNVLKSQVVRRQDWQGENSVEPLREVLP